MTATFAVKVRRLCSPLRVSWLCRAASFFADIERIGMPGYVATEQDILRSRVRTSGIVEEAYLIDSVPFV